MVEAVESSFGYSHQLIQSCGDSSEEELLSVLPRHTKVVVTGNNRTKSVLVGLHGVVKKAVGLGGWHWLVCYILYRHMFLINLLSSVIILYGKSVLFDLLCVQCILNLGVDCFDVFLAISYFWEMGF